MAEQRNIVVLGAGTAGLQTTHYILQHILPALKAKHDAKYHVYLIGPSSKWYFRVAAPRVAASTALMAAEKVMLDIPDGFKQYSANDFTFIEATVTGLNINARTVSYDGSKSTESQPLTYHALVIATGSSTYYNAFSMSAATQTTLDAINTTNKKVKSAKDIVIIGGGPTSIEFAGEVAEVRNGKPGWFSNAERKVNIQLLTASDRLLPQLPPAVSKQAEQKLNALGVDVKYKTHMTGAHETKEGRTVVELASGEKIETDLYVPAHGVLPNSTWLPASLLNEKNYLVNNHETLRVDAAGPRVYAFGDVASYSRNNVMDILFALPVLAVNIKRDLLAFDPAKPNDKPKGKDRLYKPETRAGMIVPIGTGGGVGAMMGWKLPSFLIWLVKGRDYMLGMSGIPAVSGGSVKKEVKWTAEEAAI